MREGLNINISEFALAAVLIVVLALGVGYEYTHRPLPPLPPQPPPVACVTKEPTVTIEQTFSISVPYSSSKDTQLPGTVPPTMQVTPPIEMTPEDDGYGVAPVDPDSNRGMVVSNDGPMIFPPRKSIVVPDSLR